MSYDFEIIGITSVLNFFNYQQKVADDLQRSKVYLASYQCTLDSFIESTKVIPKKPKWNWDRVIESTINFWLQHEEAIRHWKTQLEVAEKDSLIVGRVTNLERLRAEFEDIFDV